MKELVNKEKTRRFNELINQVKQIAIFTHMNPDGDAIGSALAFQMAMFEKSIQSHIFIANEIPESLGWMAGANNISVNTTQEDAEQYIHDSDLIVCLDFNEPERVGDLAPVLKQQTLPVLVIDHHPKSFEYNGLEVTTTAASSTSELLFWLLKESKALVKTREFAECLYTGIVTDTGSFAYNSSSPSTFLAVAELLEIGFDKDKVNDLVFQQFQAQRMKLLGHMLANRMIIMGEQKTAYTYLTKNDLEEYNFTPGDTEGFVNYPLSIAGIKFTAFFIEKEDEIKISFRSKGNFAANEFSSRFFNGGGHLNAAGGRSKETLDQTLKRFEELVKKHVNEF